MTDKNLVVLGQDKNICPVISGFPEAVLDGFEKLLDDGSVCLLYGQLLSDAVRPERGMPVLARA